MGEMGDVLEFWFSDDAKPSWFAPTPAFDQTIRTRFGATFARAAAGELASWQNSPEGCLPCARCSIGCRATCFAARLRRTPPMGKPVTWPGERSTGASIEV